MIDDEDGAGDASGGRHAGGSASSSSGQVGLGSAGGGVAGQSASVSGRRAGLQTGAGDAVRGKRGLEDAVWKRFTPDAIDASRCLARVWDRVAKGDGLGGQCKRKPLEGDEVCRKHKGEKLAHGKVTGEIPEGKLREFLKAEEVRRKRDGSAVVEGGEKSGGRVVRAGFVGASEGLALCSEVPRRRAGVSDIQRSLQRFAEDHGGRGLEVTVVEASLVEDALGDDARLGCELVKLLKGVLGEAAESGPEAEERCARHFRGLLARSEKGEVQAAAAEERE